MPQRYDARLVCSCAGSKREETVESAAKGLPMGVLRTRRLLFGISVTALFAVAACSGNLGTGNGLPQPPGGLVSPAAGAIGNQSRMRTTDGAVFLSPDDTELPLPVIGGFAVVLALVAPTAAPSGAPGTAGPTATPTASPKPTPSPSPGPSGRVYSSTNTPRPAATPSGPKIETKTTIYPEDVPDAPTPKPTGNVQSYAKRRAIVRGYVMPRVNLTLYALGAVRFKIPPEEAVTGRGYTIALFESGKHRRNRVLAWSPDATLGNGFISATAPSEPIVLRKNVGYFTVLYGDELIPTPGPVTSYPPPVPIGSGSPRPGTSGAPVGPGAIGAPGATPPPGTIMTTPTPMRP
jgi:hypothetical protein